MTDTGRGQHVPYVEMRGMSKRFPGVVANDGIDFQVAPGEIHALLGENGAGKTTLMRILAGLTRADAGEIRIGGQRLRGGSTREAIAHGIGMVHQHVMLVPVMTVTENILLGHENIRCGPFLTLRRAARHLHNLARHYHLDLDPHALVQDLSMGMQQRVEILKALYRQARVLILDEPTAILSADEVAQVFTILTILARQGTSIVLITHKLREVEQIAQRMTILRAGRHVLTTTPGAMTTAQLAALMVGSDLPQARRRQPLPAASPIVFKVDNLYVQDDRQAAVVAGVSFGIHAGEILGLAGVQGNGQTELVEALTGLRPVMRGTVTLYDTEITNARPRQLTALRVARIPEDGHTYGMVRDYSVADNLVLTTYNRAPFARAGVRRAAAVLAHARAAIQRFAIRAPGPDTPLDHLSGGNQQKVVVARELASPCRLLIAAQPTRGLDIAATAFVHQQIMAQRHQGCAVLLVSTELDEILALADRIAVIYHGRILAVVATEDLNRAVLGRLMAGIT